MIIRKSLCLALLFSFLAFSSTIANSAVEFVALAEARGDAGFFLMNKACDAIVKESHICTVKEIVQSKKGSISLPYGVFEGGPVEWPDLPGPWWVWDETLSTDTTCAGWWGSDEQIPNYPEYGGLLMDVSGHFETSICNITNFVACCK